MQNVEQPGAGHLAFGIRHYTAVLAVIFLALHLPFLPKSLEDLDSINFALGLRQFDVARHQPHPPGYPVYIAIGKLVHAAVPSEATVLSLIAIVAGALGVFALVALFARIDPALPRRWSMAAALMTVTAPLYWLTAARPLSDVPGLAASVAVQAFTLAATGAPRVLAAGLFAGLATGLRSQSAWLTVPLLLFVVARQATAKRARIRVAAVAGFVAGLLVWAVPLVMLSGGPRTYWRALFEQGAEDLSGVQMLWTTRTARQLALSAYYAFVAPWALWQIAAGVLLCAASGLALMYWRTRTSLAILAVAFVPYLVFDVWFQETVTTRYALPLVPPIAYLAVRAAAALPLNLGMTIAVGAALVNTLIAGFAVRGYSLLKAPAFRMLDEMAAAAAVRHTSSRRPVLGMHRREDLDLRKPIQWVGADMPAFARRLPAPPRHEWLELVKYWNEGGRDPVWFVADPHRTDLALIDRPSARSRNYAWPLNDLVPMGGVRPNEMDWHVWEPPGWYLGQGWSLTPETAGVVMEDCRDPAVVPAEGWIRRRREGVTLMLAGRNLAADGSPARVTMVLDEHPIGEFVAAAGFFFHMARMPMGSLDGLGDYARLSLSADRRGVSIEQFDAQSADRVVYGFGDGWHEREYNPSTGRMWRWMSERGVIHVRGEGHALRFILNGITETFSRPTRIRLRVGDRVIGEWTVGPRFAVDAVIPAALQTGDDTIIVVDTDQVFVPAERSRRTQDRRHLSLRVYDCQLRPVS